MINIIVGPPGTGKTTELLNICQQKKEQGVPWERIGFFSFSKKAAYEAKDRARHKFQASRDDLTHFRTLHSFAFRHLAVKEDNLMKQKHWKELSSKVGFNLVFNDNDDSVYTNSNHQFINLINKARLKDISLAEEVRLYPDPINMVKLDYLNRVINKYKKVNELYDYTDMIVDYTTDTVSTQFDVLFIDEAQDMPRVQYNMVDKLISNSKEVYIAGDDDQAIFRWSGADVDKFISLQGTVKVLDKSYRCPRRVFRLANNIITKIRNRRPKVWQPKEDEGKIYRIPHLRHIDLSSGNWLILGRTKKIRNEMIEEILLEQGHWYGRGEHRPVSTTVLGAIGS
jgi:DNA helicase-2/ATP-dependent DNA helicase PcrA